MLGLLILTVPNDVGSESSIEVLGDQTTRQILAALNVQRQTVKELAQRLNLSQPTVYRRIHILEEHDLIEERSVVTQGGSHYKLYKCQFTSAFIHLRGPNYDVEITRKSSN